MRTAHPQADTTADERHQLRQLAGTMNWPITQVMFCGSVSPSLQAATVEMSMVQHLTEANKTLRFLKTR